MSRLFDEYQKRSVRLLNGAWRFLKDPDCSGTDHEWSVSLPTEETVTIPSVWNTKEGCLTYEGVAWYEKRFYSEGGTLRICFDAVMTEAYVWLDGELLGTHYGGFSAFDFIVYNVKAGEHTLTVRVDNRFDEVSIPQKRVDWYHYGGIIRDVRIDRLCGLCVLGCRLEYTLNDSFSSVTGNAVVELCNASTDPVEDTVQVLLNGQCIGNARILLNGRERRSVTLPAFEMQGIDLWDVGKGALYTLRVITSCDDLFDRVGFRRVEVKDGSLLLNGRALELRGVNRHEEHPDWGFAFPEGLMQRDIDLILAMGCNAIRGSHYPNSKVFLDMLDAAGILFWSEIPIWGWGFSEEALADPTVVERGLEMHREMVAQYYNHPSVILWGMHNEIQLKTEAAYRMSEKYYAYLKKHGGNRAVVYASDKPWEDICFGFCDLICLNQYYGWYYGYEEDAWEQFLEKIAKHTESLGMQNKPIVISEFGWAALYGCHDGEEILWSEENQAAQLSHALEVFHAHPRVVGSFIWQFADIRTCLEAGINRARGFNNKGIMNEYRKPKLAYRVAKEKYCSFAREQEKKEI